MDELPDIRALYQRKYLSKQPLAYSFRPPPETKINNRYQMLSQRFSSSMEKYTPVEKHTMKCVKIVKAQTEQNRLEQNQGNKINSDRREAWGPVNISQSAQVGRKRSQLTRQLLRLSGQSEGDLEEGLQFGQKNLLSMFQTFFEQRHKVNQRRRKESRSNQFQPMRYPTSHQAVKPEQPRPSPTTHRKRVIVPAMGVKQKQLQPWDFNESDAL